MAKPSYATAASCDLEPEPAYILEISIFGGSGETHRFKTVGAGFLDDHREGLHPGRLIASLHMGWRQTSSLDQPDRFLFDQEKAAPSC